MMAVFLGRMRQATLPVVGLGTLGGRQPAGVLAGECEQIGAEDEWVRRPVGAGGDSSLCRC